jgi:hypothetical protein
MRDEVHLRRSGRNGYAVHFDFHLLRDNDVRQARVVRPRRDVSRIQPSATSAFVIVVQMAAEEAKPCTNTIGSCFTLTATVADLPSTEAVIVAVPKCTDVMTPETLTVATAVSVEVQRTARSVNTLPFASLTVGVI